MSPNMTLRLPTSSQARGFFAVLCIYCLFNIERYSAILSLAKSFSANLFKDPNNLAVRFLGYYRTPW